MESLIIVLLVVIALAVFGLGAHFVAKVNVIHNDLVAFLSAHGLSLASIKTDTSALKAKAEDTLTGEVAEKAKDEIASAKADLLSAFEKVKALVAPNTAAESSTLTAGAATSAGASAVAAAPASGTIVPAA